MDRSGIDPLVVDIFATKGIDLVAATRAKYVWSFTPYLKDGPEIKDLEVLIRQGDYMGRIVHRVVVPDVHYENSPLVADKVLSDFASLSCADRLAAIAKEQAKSSLPIAEVGAIARSARHVTQGDSFGM